MNNSIPFQAEWIWKNQAAYNPYHQTILARKTFQLGNVRRAVIKITADGFYRLFVNGEWVNDGPGRSWPEHFQYDEMDVTAYLKAGRNELRVIARHWSVGTFHSVPQQAGLLAQLEVELENGDTEIIATNRTWQAAEAGAWLPDTPKICTQMEPQETYDARREEAVSFEKARVLFAAPAGPWKDLRASDAALLTRKPLPFRYFMEANLVKRSRDLDFCVPTARLANPGLIEANIQTGNAGGLCALLELEQAGEIVFYQNGFRVSVDGQHHPEGRYPLKTGRHLVLALTAELFGLQKEQTLRFIHPPASLKLINPLDAAYPNPWCWISFPEFVCRNNDLTWPGFSPSMNKEGLSHAYRAKVEELSQAVDDIETFQKHLGDRARCLPADQMLVRDTHWQFMGRAVAGSALERVENPAALMADNAEVTVVHLAAEGDVELVYDLSWNLRMRTGACWWRSVMKR